MGGSGITFTCKMVWKFFHDCDIWGRYGTGTNGSGRFLEKLIWGRENGFCSSAGPGSCLPYLKVREPLWPEQMGYKEWQETYKQDPDFLGQSYQTVIFMKLKSLGQKEDQPHHLVSCLSPLTRSSWRDLQTRSTEFPENLVKSFSSA